ncbi:MAG: DNA gyrase subunit A, partial [Deltaproteobacteria bacterium]|nr:DNA gyrase subunit A [Deltaproteobacteria bacterium]
AIIDGQPKVMNLSKLLNEFVRFRREVVTRRLVFDLRKARARAHILEGLKIAIDSLDKVIKLIRASKGPAEAKEALIKAFKFSVIQAQAILDMKLQRLTALERDKLDNEYKEIKKVIKGLEEILASTQLLMALIVDELKELKDKYGDERRTEIVGKAEDITMEDIVVEEDMVVTISHKGYIKRNPTSLFRIQKRGGKGRKGMTTREEDFVSSLFVASTHSHILFFTDRGKIYSLKVYDIPQAGTAAKGKAIVNILNIAQDEKITAFLPVREFESGSYIIMGTSAGIVKKTDLMCFANIRAGGLIGVNLDAGDSLISARLTDGNGAIFLGTRDGKAIHFNETDVREMGRQTRGVRGIKLAKGDAVVSMEAIKGETTILTVTEKGYGKRTKLSDYRMQSRGGSGLINIKVTDKNGPVAGMAIVTDNDEIMITTTHGKIIRISMGDVSVIGRSTQGVKVMGVKEDEIIAGIAPIAEKAESEEDSPDDIGSES